MVMILNSVGSQYLMNAVFATQPGKCLVLKMCISLSFVFSMSLLDIHDDIDENDFNHIQNSV